MLRPVETKDAFICLCPKAIRFVERLKFHLRKVLGLGDREDTIHMKLVNIIGDWLVSETLSDYSFRDLLIRRAILYSLPALMAGHAECPE